MTRNSAKRQLIHENIVLAKVMKLTDTVSLWIEEYVTNLSSSHWAY